MPDRWNASISHYWSLEWKQRTYSNPLHVYCQKKSTSKTLIYRQNNFLHIKQRGLSVECTHVHHREGLPWWPTGTPALCCPSLLPAGSCPPAHTQWNLVTATGMSYRWWQLLACLIDGHSNWHVLLMVTATGMSYRWWQLLACLIDGHSYWHVL